MFVLSYFLGCEFIADTLRKICAHELRTNPKDYINPHCVCEAARIDGAFTEDTYFHMCLREDTSRYSDDHTRIQTITYEGNQTIADRRWSSFIHILALAKAIGVSIKSVYPDQNQNNRTLLNRVVGDEGGAACAAQIIIMWTRSGNLDNRPSAQFEPNHFVPLVHYTRLSTGHAFLTQQSGSEAKPSGADMQTMSAEHKQDSSTSGDMPPSGDHIDLTGPSVADMKTLSAEPKQPEQASSTSEDMPNSGDHIDLTGPSVADMKTLSAEPKQPKQTSSTSGDMPTSSDLKGTSGADMERLPEEDSQSLAQSQEHEEGDKGYVLKTYLPRITLARLRLIFHCSKC